MNGWDERFPVVELTAVERAALRRVLEALQQLPRSLSLVPTAGALEVWARRKIPGGTRWVRRRRVHVVAGPGLAAAAESERVVHGG